MKTDFTIGKWFAAEAWLKDHENIKFTTIENDLGQQVLPWSGEVQSLIDAHNIDLERCADAIRADCEETEKRKLILHATNEHPAIYREGHRLVAGKNTNTDTAKLDGSGHPIPNPYYNPLLSALDKIETYCQKQIVCNSNESILWANCKQIAVEAINNWEQT